MRYRVLPETAVKRVTKKRDLQLSSGVSTQRSQISKTNRQG